MTEDRTEELALEGLLHIHVGRGSSAKTEEVPVLLTGQSKKWQRVLGESVATVKLPDSPDGQAFMGELTTAIPELIEDLFVAYLRIGDGKAFDRAEEIDKPYPERDGLLAEMTQQQVYSAVKQMVRAEFPLVVDARSAAAAFGPQVMAAVRQALIQFLPGSSTSSPSASGDSTPGTSDGDSPTSSSSSTGPTPNVGKSRRLKAA